jgi:hypothetical protein
MLTSRAEVTSGGKERHGMDYENQAQAWLMPL